MAGAGILSDVSALRKESEALNGKETDDDILRHMGRMLAIYRDRRTMVMRMILIAKVGAVVFLLIGGWNLITALGGKQEPLALYGGLIAAAMNIAIGIAALFMSLRIGTSSAAWDVRLQESERA